ncbi:carbohydrate porin [Dyella dinghuensis]|nr:carbohydrate porin [Dyella dinghuensis]
MMPNRFIRLQERGKSPAGPYNAVRYRRKIVGVAALLACASAFAAPPPISVPISSEEGANGQPADFASFLSNLKRSNFMLGDMFGLRSKLSKYGISLAIQETSEVLGNVTGGTRKGAQYDGLTQMVMQLDTNRGFGWYGGLFNISALQIHGQNLSADNLGTLQTASGIEADRATRLWEMWYDQKFLEEDRLDIKVGQQSVDQEFIVSQNASYFVNTMFGWPALPSYNMPGGGPAYPLSALGVRFRYRPIDSINLLLGVYNGSPVSNNTGDPQQQNASGTSFPLGGGRLIMAEMQYLYPALGSMVYPGESTPLARTYRIGAWYDTESFNDVRYDANGLPLASPQSNGVPGQHRGNFSLYAVADQMLWRNAHDPNNTLNAFARVMGTPQNNRNLIRDSMNAGLVYHEPFRNRPDDTFGVGIGYVHVTTGIQGYDRDVATYAELTDPYSYNPIQGSETYVEATYQYQVRPWWQLQPDLQYVFNPGAGVADPSEPTHRIRNELVLGLRTNILF